MALGQYQKLGSIIVLTLENVETSWENGDLDDQQAKHKVVIISS